jgi:hypothetical protein
VRKAANVGDSGWLRWQGPCLIEGSGQPARVRGAGSQSGVDMKPNLPRTGLLIASATLATLVLSAGPALAAQHHGGGGGGARSSGGGGGQAHAQVSRQVSSAPMRSAPVRSAPVQAGPRVSPQVARPVYAQRSSEGARPVYGERSFSGARTVGNPVVVGRAVERPAYSGTYGRSVFVGGDRRFEGGRRFFPSYGWSGRAVFAEPFFRFRPRFTFGFGLVVGYPVAFPYGYYYSPYDYAYGYPVYGMAEPVPVNPDSGYYGAPTAAPESAANYGGVTFDIQPTNAAVYVDGKYIGTVAEFSPQQPPLSLTLGRHHVDIRSQGFQTMSFDMDVVAGQVTPYQGAMTVIR